MPELPEVETISRDLNTHLSGRSLERISILDDRNLRNIKKNIFINEIQNTNISKIYRLGKGLIWELSNGTSLLFHLRMTGKFIIQPHDAPFEKHTMIIFRTNKEDIVFSDIRKFATINLLKTTHLKDNKYLKSIGIDPTHDTFTNKKLLELIKVSSKKTTKSFLLEQNQITGIGNIYASEILFDAKILPDRLIESLTNKETNALYKSITSILLKAISLRGTTFSDYRDGFNKKGEFQNELKVYNKYNENCSVCGKKIKKMKQNGRSTFYCDDCQA